MGTHGPMRAHTAVVYLLVPSLAFVCPLPMHVMAQEHKMKQLSVWLTHSALHPRTAPSFRALHPVSALAIFSAR